MKVDGALVPLAIPREDFARTVLALRRAGFTGVNVTVPHKEAAFALADVTDAAEMAGAANLLIFHADGRIEGRNTDTVGLRRLLRENMESLKGKTVVLLGAGGAARGGLLALGDALNAGRIHLLNRSPGKAAQLAMALKTAVNGDIQPGALEDWANVAGHADLIVNSTSAGMKGQPPLDLDLALLRKDAVVLDIVYNPLETPLLKTAKARGLKTIDGLGMLMHQAAPSFEAFFGVRPKVTPGLRAHLEKALHA